MSESRRLMGLDHGQTRIGVALSDPFGLFAHPHSVVTCTSPEATLATLGEIARREQVGKIVVGLPTDSQGGIGPQAIIVIRWARELAERTGLPVVFWDESYSSAEAAALMRDSGQKKRRRGEPLDDVAAAAILQDYLDAGGTDHEPGHPLEAFTDTP